jgi:hypothetical protein
MWAFDLIELDGDDLRREPLERRKGALARMLARAAEGVRLNEHLEAEGPIVFEHACRMGSRSLASTVSQPRPEQCMRLPTLVAGIIGASFTAEDLPHLNSGQRD